MWNILSRVAASFALLSRETLLEPRQSQTQQSCISPITFEILALQGYSTDGVTVKYLNFLYVNRDSGVACLCQLNSSSTPVPVLNPATRWPCDNPNVEFIWRNNVLTLVQATCFPGSTSSQEGFEVAGSTDALSFLCDNKSWCAPYGIPCNFAVTDITTNFTSLSPVAQD